ncbi:unnamed protein product [Camellia sinensis]
MRLYRCTSRGLAQLKQRYDGTSLILNLILMTMARMLMGNMVSLPSAYQRNGRWCFLQTFHTCVSNCIRVNCVVADRNHHQPSWYLIAAQPNSEWAGPVDHVFYDASVHGMSFLVVLMPEQPSCWC